MAKGLGNMQPPLIALPKHSLHGLIVLQLFYSSFEFYRFHSVYIAARGRAINCPRPLALNPPGGRATSSLNVRNEYSKKKKNGQIGSLNPVG